MIVLAPSSQIIVVRSGEELYNGKRDDFGVGGFKWSVESRLGSIAGVGAYWHVNSARKKGSRPKRIRSIHNHSYVVYFTA